MPLDNSDDWASQAQTEPHQLVGGYGVPYWDKSWWEKFRQARSIRERNEIVTTLVDQMPVKWDTLPQLPFWAPLFNVTQGQYKTLVAQRLMATSFILGNHPLAQEDIDLVAHAAAKRSVTVANGRPLLALGAGVVWAYGFNTYSFPLVKPKPPKFNPEIFPSKRFTFATGPRAIMAWQGTRLVAWYALWRILGGWAVDAYAEVNFSQAVLRNKEFRQKITDAEKTAQNALSRAQERPELRDAYSAQHATDHDHQDNQKQVPQLAQTPYYQRVQQHQQEQRQQRQAQPQQTQQPTSYNHDDDDYLYDDASPVAPSARGTSTGTSPVVQTSGSAWDRLRQQAKAGPAQAPGSTTATTPATYVKPSQSPSWAERRAAAAGGGEGMSYTYSETDQDKALAKEQAQREFDAMLERERRGDGSGRGRGF